MLGRGIVHPLDLHHAGNPPSHPELLDLLGGELAAHHFDMRWLLREIALSQMYQRSSVLAADLASGVPEQSYRVALEKPLAALARIRSGTNAIVSIIPAQAARLSSSRSCASNTGSLSSCMSFE